MNQNTSGAVLVLILAAAGFVQHEPAVWALAAATAGLAFLKAETDLAHVLTGKLAFQVVAVALALASWATVAVAAFILAI